MRRSRLLILAALLPLLLAAAAIPLRHLDNLGRAAALARAVRAGDRDRVGLLLARDADPNTWVAVHPSPGDPMVTGYQSLVRLAEEQGDPRMAALLQAHGGASQWEPAPLPDLSEWLLSEQRQPAQRNSPWFRLWQRLSWHFARRDEPPKVDLLAVSWQAGSYAGIAPALLILGGALRMLGLGLPRQSDLARTQRSLAQGAALILLGALLSVAVNWLVP